MSKRLRNVAVIGFGTTIFKARWIEKTYYELFGIAVSVKSIARESLETRFVGGKLPDFWRAGEYFVFSSN